MTLIRKIFIATALLMLGGPAFAVGERPAPPQEVFRYVAYDAGDAIELDWAVADGAYMYRDKLAFSSADAAIVFGAVEIPFLNKGGTDIGHNLA